MKLLCPPSALLEPISGLDVPVGGNGVCGLGVIGAEIAADRVDSVAEGAIGAAPPNVGTARTLQRHQSRQSKLSNRPDTQPLLLCGGASGKQ